MAIKYGENSGDFVGLTRCYLLKGMIEENHDEIINKLKENMKKFNDIRLLSPYLRVLIS